MFETQRRVQRRKLLRKVLIFALSGFALCAFAPQLAPHDAFAQILSERYQAPSWNHPLGTDQFGRDVFSRMLLGARVTLGFGFAAAVLALALGALLGSAAGYFGGKLDALVMRAADLLLAFPLVYLLVACAAFFGSQGIVLVFMMSLTSWMDVARLVRAEVMSLKERDFIKAAHVLGFRRGRIIFFHLLPNALAPVTAFAALRLADVILLESSLSFLGLGVQPPGVSWGSIIRDGRDALASAWWIATFPGLALALTAIALNALAESFRKATAT